MTTPLRILPADVHSFATDQRLSADGFMTAPAPPAPPDDPDDPTQAATGEFTDSVHRSRTSLHQRAHRHADGMDAAANALQNQDEQGAANIAAVAPKDQMAMFTGASKDLLGIGTGAFKDISGVFTSTLQSFTAAAGSALTAGVGAGSSALGAAAGAAGKLNGGAVGPSAGVGGAAPIAGGAADDKDRRGAAAQTHAASSSQSPVLPDAGSNSGRAGYNHSGHDRQDVSTVQPAGMAMPGSALGGMGASAGSPVAKVHKTARIVTGAEQPEPDDPPTAPIPVEAVKRAVASI